MPKKFSELHHKRWDHFTLGELQLLKLGLEVIGERNQVDFNLTGDCLRLRTQIGVACEKKAAEAATTPESEAVN